MRYRVTASRPLPGAAYKWIKQQAPGGASLSDEGPTYLIGFGAEADLPNSLFARAEYEYIGKIGTSTVIDPNHTAISASIGLRF